MRLWIAMAMAGLVSVEAWAGRITVTLDAVPSGELEVTDGEALCVWIPGRISGVTFTDGIFKAKRGTKHGACVSVKAETFEAKTIGKQVTLEWTATPRATTVPKTGVAAASASTPMGTPTPTPAATPTQAAAPPPAPTPTPAATPTPTPSPTPTPAATEDVAKGVLDNYKKYVVDISIPESPAFTVLNVTPTDVVRPSSMRAWATSLMHGVDKDGKLKDGLALEGAPYALLNRKMSLFEYTQLNPFAKAMMNTHVSMGTAKGSQSDDKSMKLGLGLRVRLFDLGDPREDSELIECFTRKAAAQQPAGDFFRSGVGPGNFEDCHAKRKSARWNASSGIVGLGQAWISTTGNFSDRERSTRGAWTTLAYGFEGMPGMTENFQLLGHYKALDNERVADPLDGAKFVDRDTRLGAAQLRFGIEEFAGSFETSWARQTITGRLTERVRRYAIGIEYKVAPNVWLIASTGGQKGGNGDNKGFVMGTIRFGQGTSSTFDPQVK
jgi:hypothetical protein